MEKAQAAAEKVKGDLAAAQVQVTQLASTLRQRERDLKSAHARKDAAVEAAIRKTKTAEAARHKADFEQRLAKRLAEELERRAATPQQEGCAHEIALAQRLKALFPQHDVIHAKQRTDIHLVVGRTSSGEARDVIVAEEKHQEIITEADVTKAVEGASKVKNVRHVLVVTTARFISMRRKREPLHGIRWLHDRQVMIVSVDAVESIYLYLVQCLEAAQKERRANGDASIAQDAITFLRSPSWRAYLRSVSERYREAHKQLDDDRRYANNSFKNREKSLGKIFYDMDFIRTAVEAVMTKRAVPIYAMPRNVRSLLHQTQSSRVVPLRPVRAAYRRKPR